MENQTIHLLDSAMRLPKKIKNDFFELSLFSTRSRYHEKNEDSLGCVWFDNGDCILAVADGVGSCSRAAEASQIGVTEVTNHVAKNGVSSCYRSAILEAFDAANERILKEVKGSSTTLVVTEIHQGWMRSFHAGDSLAMVVGGRGKQKYMTVGHSPFEIAREVGLSTHDQDESELRNTITNCLGDQEMRIEVGPRFTTSPQDMIIMGSDGLFDNVDVVEEAQQLTGSSPDSLMHHLLKKGLHQMYEFEGDSYCKADDLTMLAFKRQSLAQTKTA